ncbi:putative colipase [Trichinella spiralis]|uniref:putative colipase n=1 Tax=Trichinella spiralis TaxID=6334 RepID=UPI0001EFB53F|nr:putative colipase [Trichinella spiralis]
MTGQFPPVASEQTLKAFEPGNTGVGRFFSTDFQHFTGFFERIAAGHDQVSATGVLVALPSDKPTVCTASGVVQICMTSSLYWSFLRWPLIIATLLVMLYSNNPSTSTWLMDGRIVNEEDGRTTASSRQSSSRPCMHSALFIEGTAISTMCAVSSLTTTKSGLYNEYYNTESILNILQCSPGDGRYQVGGVIECGTSVLGPASGGEWCHASACAPGLLFILRPRVGSFSTFRVSVVRREGGDADDSLPSLVFIHVPVSVELTSPI